MTGARLPLAPVMIDQDPEFSGFEVRQGDRSTGGLDWGEMIALITSLTRSPEGGPRYPMLTAEEWEERRRKGDDLARQRQAEEAAFTTLRLPTNDLRDWSYALADVLCWASGFAAANYDRGLSGPMGVEAIRTLNQKIKAALAAKQQENAS
ncbi:hypothetical protein V5F34_08660 [Xanthobacter autotrophicus]|uniref:hypothetical protein n=1 Tax=Xanthobacter autotrophicus TaxID=280 RepID=UPI003729EACB